ncbi:hypothetical protein FRC05_002586 [Tulasnella sp. 425]|nr:hypothetical protein FRC05_002586 [Tulasnella sp. 425]
MAWLYTPPDLAVGLFNTVMPLLHTVKLVSAGRTPSLTDTPFGAEVKVLQNVAVYGGPATWGLGHFRGLRTWRLKGLRGDGFTTQHILGILRENPLLEILEINRLRVQVLPENTLLTPIPLLRLTSLTMRSCHGDLVDHILRRIQIPMDRVKRLYIAVRAWRSLNPIRLLTDVLASWSPVFQRAHQTCRGSKFHLPDLGNFYWRAKGNGTTVYMHFSGIKPVTGVQWMVGILSQVDGSRAGASIECESTALKTVEDLKLLGSTDMITTFDVSVGRTGVSFKQALLQALSDPATPAFPCLETLKIQGFSWDMESVVKMLRARFTDHGTGVTQLPRLTIEISYPNWSSDSPVQRQIIDFDTVKAISALKGVERLHLGCAIGKDGMLGVVWSDELGVPTWG